MNEDYEIKVTHPSVGSFTFQPITGDDSRTLKDELDKIRDKYVGKDKTPDVKDRLWNDVKYVLVRNGLHEVQFHLKDEPGELIIKGDRKIDQYALFAAFSI